MSRAAKTPRAARRPARLRTRGAALALLALLTSLAPPARAQASEATRTEARERFDRGLRLFNQGDSAGALAEFLRAYELVPHPLVLFNLGLVYQAMGKPVEAVSALDRVLAAPGSLDRERLERAREVRAEQVARIGFIQVSVNVPGASVELDGLEAGRSPLAGPLNVAVGTHVVSVVAPGHSPMRRSVAVAGGATVSEAFELVPLTARLAHLTLRSSVLDAEVVVDGAVIGRTPLPASVALAPGAHTIELRRSGYRSARTSVTLGEGTAGEVALEPEVDAQALASAGGDLALSISEPDGVVFVNGAPRGPYSGPMRLPAGRHRLRVERADFFPFERDVVVPQGSRASVVVDLAPTPEKRAAYRSAAVTQRTWGYIATGSGLALGLGGGAFLLWNAGEKSDKREVAEDRLRDADPGGPCDPSTQIPETCAIDREIAIDELDAAEDRDLYGFIGVGVGAAALGLGLVLLFTADDPDRYEPRPESDVFGSLRLSPAVLVLPGGGAASLRGEF